MDEEEFASSLLFLRQLNTSGREPDRTPGEGHDREGRDTPGARDVRGMVWGSGGSGGLREPKPSSANPKPYALNPAP